MLNSYKNFGNKIHIADALLDRVLEKGMAETHMHTGASRSFSLIWESMLSSVRGNQHILEKSRYSLPFKEPIEENKMIQFAREAALIRLILAMYLQNSSNEIAEFFCSEAVALRYRRFFLQKLQETLKYGVPSNAFSEGVIWEDPLLTDLNERDYDLWSILKLSPELKFACPTLAEQCFISWSILHILNVPCDTGFTAMFLYYLRIKSRVYRSRVEDSKGKGLSYFQKYYALSTDTGELSVEDKLSQFMYTALQDARVVKTEFRLSPPFSSRETIKQSAQEIEAKIRNNIVLFIQQHIYALILIYGTRTGVDVRLKEEYFRAWQIAEKSICDGQQAVLLELFRRFDTAIKDIPAHRLGVVYHLIKRGEKAERFSCFAKKGNSSELGHYQNYSFGTARFQYEADVVAISNVRDICPELSRLIVGIDAASLEIPTEPWVFAPAFSMAKIRNAVLARRGRSVEKKALLGATYHVGEDFNHPISGLRHIDEAIEYLKLHAGDRLGHGLALGIDLDRWYRTHGLIAIPRIEWMENYLWIWNLLSHGYIAGTISGYSGYIEKQIMKCAGEIYGTLNGITIEKLLFAYSSKAFPTEKIDKMAEDYQKHCDSGIDCCQFLDKAKTFPCITVRFGAGEPMWTEETLALSYHCGFYKAKMKEPTLITPVPEQIELSKELQGYIREKIAKIGLIIEANPSSNTTIGEMDGILLHPIWNLRESSENRVMASINTDDPSVFNASVANEHAQIYYALRYHGYSAEDALKCVDEMRKIGMETSFIDTVSEIDQLLLEYENIIRAIKGTPIS